MELEIVVAVAGKNDALRAVLEATAREVVALYTRLDLHALSVVVLSPPVRFWDSLRLRDLPAWQQQVSSDSLGEAVADAVSYDGPIIVLTDVGLQVPTLRFNYVIMRDFGDDGERGTVISSAPCDPAFWANRLRPDAGLTDLQHVKTRVRAATIAVVGEWLGLERCENSRCYLFAPMNDVEQLAERETIGDEHGVSVLTGLGFADVGAPSDVEVPSLRSSEPRGSER